LNATARLVSSGSLVAPAVGPSVVMHLLQSSRRPTILASDLGFQSKLLKNEDDATAARVLGIDREVCLKIRQIARRERALTPNSPDPQFAISQDPDGDFATSSARSMKSYASSLEYLLQLTFTNFPQEGHLIAAISPYYSGIVPLRRPCDRSVPVA
jgi:hypothetical protein